MNNNKKKFLIFASAMALCILLYICHRYGMFHSFTVQVAKDCIKSFGVFAPLGYIIMFTLVPLTPFPDAVLALAGGMVFGVGQGMLYTIIGASSGATLSFFISRFIGKGLVEKLVKHKGKWFQEGVEKRGFVLIFILRLIPLIPFDVISYSAGLSKIRYKDFIAATMLGIIPGVYVYCNLGDKASNIMSLEFLKASCILVALMLASYYLKKKISLDKIYS